MTPALFSRVQSHLEKIYPNKDSKSLAERAVSTFKLDDPALFLPTPDNTEPWSQEDIALITYGNSITAPDQRPLKTLDHFLDTYLNKGFSIVHILPFFPYSSDDGFAVMDYYRVNPALGNWEDVTRISQRCRLMSDLVLNHTSSRSYWFENFKKGVDPGKDYFVTVEPECDLSRVVRPRTSPLLREVPTPDGPRHVWCTFSHDQVDLDFKNPEVLFEFLAIIRYYLDKGVEIFRLDAVAFLWKEACTTCLHLAQTHEIIKLFRTLLGAGFPRALIITETNVPSNENLAYLGQGDEAQVVYNFPLPPLLLHTMVSGDSGALTGWLKTLPPVMASTTFLNFIASHDGIGLRPVEGLLSDLDMDRLITCMKTFGARISTRALNDHQDNPYEINISLWDAMKGTVETGPDPWQLPRFVCAHAIMLCLQGIPAIYIHSLLGTENDTDRRDNLRSNRAVNRHIWEYDDLKKALADSEDHHHKVFHRIRDLVLLRKKQPAFHPDAAQMVLDTDSKTLAVVRKKDSGPDAQTILCLFNIWDKPVDLGMPKVNGEVGPCSRATDLITGKSIPVDGTLLLAPYGFVWLSFED